MLLTLSIAAAARPSLPSNPYRRQALSYPRPTALNCKPTSARRHRQTQRLRASARRSHLSGGRSVRAAVQRIFKTDEVAKPGRCCSRARNAPPILAQGTRPGPRRRGPGGARLHLEDRSQRAALWLGRLPRRLPIVRQCRCVVFIAFGGPRSPWTACRQTRRERKRQLLAASCPGRNLGFLSELSPCF
jgi:hypothetical protein